MMNLLGLDWATLVTGLLVFGARVIDMSIGTVRTIATVQGRTILAFFLGLIEVSLWLFVVSTVIQQIQQNPILAAFYAVGFSTGNAVGILVEKRLAMGHQIVRLITPKEGQEMAGRLRAEGFKVTVFQGAGARGPVHELYVVCKRREARLAIKLAQTVNPDVFFITETPGQVRRLRHQLAQRPTGWRAVFKRK
jgi:uncharacterized protein YebE (UPF0316 family)